MGIGSSHPTKLEREFGGLGDGNGEERFFGLENFGNTCYCNSVLQARCRVCCSVCTALESMLSSRTVGSGQQHAAHDRSGELAQSFPIDTPLSSLSPAVQSNLWRTHCFTLPSVLLYRSASGASVVTELLEIADPLSVRWIAPCRSLRAFVQLNEMVLDADRIHISV